MNVCALQNALSFQHFFVVRCQCRCGDNLHADYDCFVVRGRRLKHDWKYELIVDFCSYFNCNVTFFLWLFWLITFIRLRVNTVYSSDVNDLFVKFFPKNYTS